MKCEAKTELSKEFTHSSPRNETDDKGMRQRYFGTGETFLFRAVVGGGEETVETFHWVGGQEGEEEEEKGDHAAELFMSGDQTMITVGGG